MTLDPGIAAIAVVAITLASGAAGALIQRHFAAADRREAATLLDARERRTRLRDYDLKRIDHTRRQLERTRIALLSILAGSTNQKEIWEELERSDMAVVGDAAAARQWATVAMGIAKSAEEHLRRTGQLPTRLPTDQESTDLTAAREAVMAALDRQERRVLSDQPPILTDVQSQSGQDQGTRPPSPPV